MKIIRHLDQLPESLRGGAVSVGNFDGVHRGHAQLVERLVHHARQHGGPAIVFTFDPHPVSLLRPDQVPARLTATPQSQLLETLGVDALVAYPTDLEMLNLSPGDFFQKILVEQLAVRALVEGPNFFFGKDRSGDIEMLAQLAAEADVQVEIVQPVQAGGVQVSSSLIRSFLQQGDVEQARKLLTAPYRVRGLVERGAGRGAALGFATANLGQIETLTPGVGVYAGIGYLGEQALPAAIHMGPNPTFGETQNKIEVHLIGLNQPLYGEWLEVDFLRRLRDIQPFESVQALQRQLQQDIALAAESFEPRLAEETQRKANL